MKTIMHSNSHPSHLPTQWTAKVTDNYEDFIPFTPCLTPASSDSSSISSPMLSERNFAIKEEPQPQFLWKPKSNTDEYRRITFDTTSGRPIRDSSRQWSSHFQTTMPFSPQGGGEQSPSSYYHSSSASPRSTSSNSPEYYTSPPKKSRKLTSAQGQTPYYPDDPSRGETKYDPSSSQFYSRGGHSSHPSGSRASSSKGKTPMNQSQHHQQQPTKFRFVSVQSAGGPPQGYNAGGSGTRDESKVYLEEHMEDDNDDGPFEHGPSEYPPRPYTGGEYASSPLRPKKPTGKIPASNLDFLPVLEARFDRLENAIERYVEYRGQQALENSVLPHQQHQQQYPNSSSSTSKHRK